MAFQPPPLVVQVYLPIIPLKGGGTVIWTFSIFRAVRALNDLSGGKESVGQV